MNTRLLIWLLPISFLACSDPLEPTLPASPEKPENNKIASPIEPEDLLESLGNASEDPIPVDEVVNHQVAAMRSYAFDSTHLNLTARADSMMNCVSTITLKCTMKGRALEEIHLWMLPLIEEINNIQMGVSTDLDRLREIFAAYDQYFSDAAIN